MPFTPFHLGPALAFGLPLRRYLHAPTFVLANIILDIEPFLVLIYRFNYPLHGYLHTFLLASLVGALLGCAIFVLERFLQPVYKAFLLVPKNSSFKLKTFLFSGAFGAMLHVMFDLTLYSEIQPFFPITGNPLHNLLQTSQTNVYALCIWLGIFGATYYVGLLVLAAYKSRYGNK